MHKLIPLILLFANCSQPMPKPYIGKNDSASNIDKDPVTLKPVSAYVAEQKSNSLFDTIGVHDAPVKIVSKSLVEDEYTTYRSVRLRWKNISKKKISAIRFKWYGVNAFQEPADMGQSVGLRGFGAGFSDDALAPGHTSSGTWNVYSKDARKIIFAWPYEIAFADGTFWKSR